MNDYIAEDTIDRLIAERDAAIAEAADLRRQLTEAQAQLTDSVRIVERKRGKLLIAPDDFDYQPSEQL